MNTYRKHGLIKISRNKTLDFTVEISINDRVHRVFMEELVFDSPLDAFDAFDAFEIDLFTKEIKHNVETGSKPVHFELYWRSH